MPDTNSERDPIEALASEFVDRLRRGEHPAIEEYATGHPALAEKIKKLFPTIANMERLKSLSEPLPGRAAVLSGPQPENLGDFRIVREIGRGGMGIVYEAEQKSLRRCVAVKVLPQSSLRNPTQLQRFHREAQTAAGLHHTNIVPVFGVGEEAGYHYIVMQMIVGVGLDEILLQLTKSVPKESAETEAPGPAIKNVVACRNAEVADTARMLVRTNLVLAAGPGSSVHHDSTGRDAAAARTHISQATTDNVDTMQASTVSDGPGPPLPYQGEAAALSYPMRIGPTYWGNVARLGVQVADALDYAHDRGVLHRDIKPSNLIVDRQGVIFVTDFGLAKAMADESVSRTGDIVGTLRYMAPERLHGEVNVRSDIYSLGLTLYEMCALRPAYETSDASRLLRKITQEPPARLAVAAPGIPRDLETIVMKAVAREPAHRYQTAGELAEDLRLFLQDRPIHARRVSSVERLWRWCGRNRVVAGLAATALTLLVMVAAVASIGYVRTNEALIGESQQRRKAEATSQLAQDALDDIFTQFAPERTSEVAELSLGDSSGSTVQVPVQPVLSKEAAALLERLLVFYDRLAAQGGDDASLRRKSADANRRVGDIREKLGQFEQAQAAYLRAIESYRQMEAETPADVSIAAQIARIYNSLGELQTAAGSPDAACSFHTKALDTLDRLAQTSDTSSAVRYEIARTCYMLGRGRPRGIAPGGPPLPQDPHREPPSGSREHPPDGPGPPPGHPRRDEDERYLRRAIGLLEELAREQPTIPDYQHLLACCYRDLPPVGTSGPDGGRHTEGDRAIEILEQLAEDFPAVSVYQQDLARTYLDMFAQLPPEANAAAEERLREALRITEKLVAEHPNVPEYVLSQVEVRLGLSEVFRRGGRPDDAGQELRSALGLQSSLVTRFPEVVPYKMWMAMIRVSLAELLMDQGQTAEARPLLESASATLYAVPEVGPDDPHVRLLHRSYENLAVVYAQLGQEDLADEALRQAKQYREEWGLPPGLPHGQTTPRD